MATSNPTNDPKRAKADEAAIQDLPESKDSRALTPDEEKNVMGGRAERPPPPGSGTGQDDGHF